MLSTLQLFPPNLHVSQLIQASCIFRKFNEISVYYHYNTPNRPETLDVEPEEEVDTDEKGPYILQSEVEKPIKEMRNRKARGDDDVPGDVLKLLGEVGLKIFTKLINTIYETGEWPKDFT